MERYAGHVDVFLSHSQHLTVMAYFLVDMEGVHRNGGIFTNGQLKALRSGERVLYTEWFAPIPTLRNLGATSIVLEVLKCAELTSWCGAGLDAMKPHIEGLFYSDLKGEEGDPVCNFSTHMWLLYAKMELCLLEPETVEPGALLEFLPNAGTCDIAKFDVQNGRAFMNEGIEEKFAKAATMFGACVRTYFRIEL